MNADYLASRSIAAFAGLEQQSAEKRTRGLTLKMGFMVHTLGVLCNSRLVRAVVLMRPFD
jgi:hypothetical protein